MDINNKQSNINMDINKGSPVDFRGILRPTMRTGGSGPPQTTAEGMAHLPTFWKSVPMTESVRSGKNAGAIVTLNLLL